MLKKNNLGESTKKVFDDCSSVYLKEDKHWGSDLDIIKEYIEKKDEVSVLEVGTGYAWHLANLFYISSSKLIKVIGIDYSKKMLRKAANVLKSIFYKNVPLSERIELINCDLLSLPFENDNFDVILMLNNTLGNITSDTFETAKLQRKKALNEIKRVLKPNGYLILSVYNANKLTEEDKYGKVFQVNHKLSDSENFDLVVDFIKTHTSYYSHWFTLEEIKNLIYSCSFKVEEYEIRRKRIVVVARSK